MGHKAQPRRGPMQRRQIIPRSTVGGRGGPSKTIEKREEARWDKSSTTTIDTAAYNAFFSKYRTPVFVKNPGLKGRKLI
jgi:hypothetical protein